MNKIFVSKRPVPVRILYKTPSLNPRVKCLSSFGGLSVDSDSGF